MNTNTPINNDKIFFRRFLIAIGYWYLFLFLLICTGILQAEDNEKSDKTSNDKTLRNTNVNELEVGEFSDAILNAAVEPVLRLTIYGYGIPPKDIPFTGFCIHPSGFFVISPLSFPYKTLKVLESHFGERVLMGVSHIPQLNLVIVKASPSEPIPYVKFENSLPLNLASRLFSVSNLFNAKIICRGYPVDMRHSHYTEMFETNEALLLNIPTDTGALGSPVFNQRGKVIGIISSFVKGEHLLCPIAIPSKEFLTVSKKLANTVTLYGFKLDMETQEVDGKDELIVSAIGEHSELAKFDIKTSDKITKLGEWEIKCETDFWLSQLAWCMENYNEPVPITLTRKDIETPFTVKIPWTEEKLQGEPNPPENLKRGLQITVVKKDTEDILLSGRTESLAGPGMTPNTKCELTGFLKIFREGTYAFHLGVPGTGILKIGEQFVVEKDKKHPKMRVTGRGFFTQGLYRFSLMLDINETVTEPFIMVETPLDFIESNLPSPLSDDWIFCEDK
ncbi:MAG: trypsin-like peptidase domain-containing protein [Planctomycetaceae bacterium]|jgi:hypothetical protein|nr:trypsin-like peptidase domain-containing protein [Planctomycetaceae bacterium]